MEYITLYTDHWKEHKLVSLLYYNTATPVNNLTGNTITCHISFRTINFPCFLAYHFSVLHATKLFVEVYGKWYLQRTARTNNRPLTVSCI
jgi:hypothetical protein